MRRVATGLLLGVLGLGAMGCTGGDESTERTTLTVLAAASLTAPFTEIGELLEAREPGVRVRFSFESSATVAQQAVQGAPADLLATADPATMAAAAPVHAGDPVPFATNTMVLVADPAGDVRSVADLEDADFVLCVPTAPCGAIAQRLLDGAGVEASPVSQEIDVRAVLARVVQGEAAAGVVYASDALAAGRQVREIPLPGAQDEPTTYQVVPLAGGDRDAGRIFLDLLRSPRGQQVLAEAGFR